MIHRKSMQGVRAEAASPSPRPYGRMQFPRFEYDDDPSLEINERQLIQRTQASDWVSPMVASWMRNISTSRVGFNVQDLNMQKQTGYWGVYHGARLQDSAPVEKPFAFTNCRKPALWLTTYRHEWSWDAQAFPGDATEVVIKGFTPASEAYPDSVREIGALLLKRRSQQFVLFDEQRGWREPEPAEHWKAESMVYAMTTIALAEINRAAVDNSGRNL